MNDYAEIRMLEKSCPTDIIRLTHKTDKMLTDLWSVPQQKTTGRESAYIPSDLFFANTIPLQDCKIVIDEASDIENGMITEVRVKVFPSFRDLISKCKDGEAATVGLIQLFIPTGYIVTPFAVSPGHGAIGIYNNSWVNRNGKLVEFGLPAEGFQWVWLCLCTWYGIQVALLHPTVREIFRNPGRIPIEKHGEKAKHRGKRPPVRYIKKHIISPDSLAELIYGVSHNKSFQRKALIWYVIGHWRTYKNGRKVFIQPYWKGALRDTNKNQSREREIII